MLLRLSVIGLALGMPFLAYWLRNVIAARQGQATKRPWPVMHLLLIGASLCAILLLVIALDRRSAPNQVFVPSHLENGVLKQGHFERADR